MFLIGLALTVLSLPTAVNMFSALNKVNSNPNMYYFTNGFDSGSVTFIAIVASVIAATGMFLMVYAWLKRRDKTALDTIENHTKEKFCRKCRINVSTKNGICPICGNNFKER